jgi:hypothetical protein
MWRSPLQFHNFAERKQSQRRSRWSSLRRGDSRPLHSHTPASASGRASCHRASGPSCARKGGAPAPALPRRAVAGRELLGLRGGKVTAAYFDRDRAFATSASHWRVAPGLVVASALVGDAGARTALASAPALDEKRQRPAALCGRLLRPRLRARPRQRRCRSRGYCPAGGVLAARTAEPRLL